MVKLRQKTSIIGDVAAVKSVFSFSSKAWPVSSFCSTLLHQRRGVKSITFPPSALQNRTADSSELQSHILNLGFKCRKIGFSPVWSAPISLDHSSTICHLCIHFGDRIVGVELHPVQIQRDFRLSPKLSNSIFPSFFGSP